MFMRLFVLISVFLGGLSASVSWGQSNAVPLEVRADRAASPVIGKLGDTAPPLTVLEWVKGNPVTLQPGTNIYAIVFCTLTHANEFAITNLSALQKDYQDKGLVTVVISDDALPDLTQFVRANGQKMDFTIAADDLGRKSTVLYEKTFGQMMNPRAYIVGKDGKLLWYGHPLKDDMGLVVDQILSGRYDLEGTRKRLASRDQMDEYLMMVRQEDPRAPRAGKLLMRIRSNDAPLLCDLAFQIATAPFLPHRDAALASAALDRAEKISNTNAIEIAVDRAIVLFQTGHPETGLAAAKQAESIAKTPAEKDRVQSTVHTMETRLASGKLEGENGQTNGVNTGNP